MWQTALNGLGASLVGVPGMACVAADQVDDPARVADGSIGEEEEQPWVAPVHGLSQDPAKRRPEVGAAHVSPDLPDVLTSHSQVVLVRMTYRVITNNYHSYTICVRVKKGYDVF